ncbi:MAG: ATP-dependent helicase HrpB [Pseudomonadota bacterium]
MAEGPPRNAASGAPPSAAGPSGLDLPGPGLPIDPVLPELCAHLREKGAAVLQAPPGAGKTTRVPLALDQTLPPGRILMLEPRRVAARAAAERLAEAYGARPGGHVGYRMRGEAKPGRRIEVITEGLLTRMIQTDPELSGTICIIFDEIHERALQGDLGLALALEIRAALRPDLVLVAMSATLDAGPVAAVMEAPIVTAHGRSFPVDTRHLARPARGRFEDEAASLIGEALAQTEGGMLVFLPGEGEIRRVMARLDPADGIAPEPLFGALPIAQQRAVLRPEPDPGRRKLVLATAIAETSLTIPDIRVVVDAGRARRARFDPGSGMSRLVTERVTRAEADQRRGRAGRVAAGIAFRMWTKGEDGALAAFPPPEIASADLTGLALELALWGADTLPFLTPPPPAALAEARALLARLGALDAGGRITAHGRALAELPLHPRLGHLLIAGGAEAAPLAALLDGRDPLRGDVEISKRLTAWRDPSQAPQDQRAALARLAEETKRLRRLAPRAASAALEGQARAEPGALVALAYPDRIGLRRPGAAPRWLLSGGKEAVMAPDDPLAGQRLIAVAQTDGDPRAAQIRLAAPVAQSTLSALYADALEELHVCSWSRRARAVTARIRLMLGAIALEDRAWRDVPDTALGAAMADGVRDLGLGVLPWTAAATRLRARMAYLRGQGDTSLPDMSDAALRDRLDDWLTPHLAGMRRVEDLARLNMADLLAQTLDWSQRQALDRAAPEALTAPTGTRLPVDWSQAVPMVSVRLQELFGLTEHPRLGPRREPVRIALLSPAGRPVQVTSDLPGFWARSYQDVRKEMRGRYPRHAWPEDPTQAEPTRRAKPKRG